MHCCLICIYTYIQDRGKLKIPANGAKLQKLVPEVLHPEVARWVQKAGLRDLQFTPMKIVNHELLSAFVERWHPETSSFHLPFGEMTITLDDVSSLLHLPVYGSFFLPGNRFITF